MDFLGTPVASLQLGQLRPANTTAASLYTLPANTETNVRSVIVCNVSSAAAKLRIFHDTDGTTYDQGTAVFYDALLESGRTLEWEPTDLWLRDVSGHIAVRTDTASALTFSLYGREFEIAVTR